MAEDDTNTRRALQHYLKRSGYEVTEAASVDESLEAVFAHPSDLVILDFDIGGGTADVLTIHPASQLGSGHRLLRSLLGA